MKHCLPPIYGPDITAENWEQRRVQIVRLFEKNVFGRTPRDGFEIRADLLYAAEALEGTAKREFYRITVRTKRGSAAFHMALVLPNPQKPVPAVLMISNHEKTPAAVKGPDMSALEELMARAPKEWRTDVERMMAAFQKGGASMPQLLDIERDTAQGYWPVEQILASGRAAAAFYAGEVQPDDRRLFPAALARLFAGEDTARKPDRLGTLGVWAFAASRAADVLCAHAGIDAKKISLAGHSRGAKTALWCAAQDTRIHSVLLNDSGCTGAAVSRGKRGENVASINAFFPHWFCPSYARYAWREDEMPFDQHMLLAAVAPRLCYVASGAQDAWSDPDAEWLGAREASAAWRLFGHPELPRNAPLAGEPIITEGIGYHRREGGHDLTAWDWMQFLVFLDKNDA